MIFDSNVPGHEGKCKSVWLNRNQICQRVDGGVTGFFRNVRKRGWFWFSYGPEFHGIVRDDAVEPTN